MNNKERLEEIKKHRNEADNSTDEYEFEKINFYNLHVDWLIEQVERVHGKNNLIGLAGMYEDCNRMVANLTSQNKRYREALELLVKQETLGKDVKTGKTAISYNGMIALKGLGIFNDDEYIIYGVDEIIENVLDGHK